MIKIAICDDCEIQVNVLKELVKNYMETHHELAEITVYVKSKAFQYDIQEGAYFDLILSDIEMPDMDGMELAACIRKHLPETLIIFITSHLKYCIDAFELSVFRYIPKSAVETKLPQALQDAVKMIHLQETKFYTIENAFRMEKIPWKKILYIQREGKNSVFYLLDGSQTKARKSLAQVYDELNASDFIYVDRGTIINLSRVVSIKEGAIEMENGTTVLASYARLEQLKKELQKYWSRLL